jgi:transcriptional regulator with XRE-family HTH domain
VPAKTPNPVDVHVGNCIRMRRIMLGMNQETLGKAVGLTFQQIQKYEKGTNRIGASRLQQICDVLEIPVSFAFDGSPGSSRFESSLPQYFTDFMRSEQGARLVKAFSTITDRDMRRSIVRMVRSLAESMQGGAPEDVVQLREPASDEPADNT